MKQFWKKKAKKPTLIKDVITPGGRTVGLLRIYIPVDENGRKSLRRSPDFFNEVVQLAHEHFQLMPGGAEAIFDEFAAPIKKGGAIHATYVRDDDYRERFLRRLEQL